MPVSKARLVAQLLMKRFMAQGNLAVAPQRLGSAEDGLQLAAARHKTEVWEETSAFSGLAVQAVGYEEGKENPGVVVYVTKGSAKALRRFPRAIDDVSVEIVKVGLVSVRPDQAGKPSREPGIFLRDDRIACGGSCAAGGGDQGTIGALVKKTDEDELYLLSANHVLAGCNHIPPGMPIMAPAADDARPDAPDPRTIAKLARVIPMHSGDPRHVNPAEEDLAIGLIGDIDGVSSWQGDDDEGYDTPTEIQDPRAGTEVKKIGRTTGLTHGIVHTVVSEPIPIPCNARGFKGNVWFKNVWYVRTDDPPFALPGDSGSLVVTEDGSAAVGLLFSSSSSGNLGLIIPIRHVLRKLGVELVSGHGV
jgi:hypothetical protein